MQIRAVIFDFDLTLADSSAGIIDCTQHALRELGYDAAASEQIHAVIGLPLQAMFRTLTGDDSAEQADAFARGFVARADVVMVASTTIYPEVPRLLARLHELETAVAIVSTKFRYRIEAILDVAGLRERIDVIVGGEDVQCHKPDPEGLALALARLEIPPSAALYVGDHAVDAQAAERAGTHFVGAVSGATSFDAWSSAGKAAVRRDLGELAEWVRQRRF
ncbi:HAD-IA family hydrolase [Burkholderia sp. Ac-20353]|uniref:HAD family hydrolase n=1 Tax=Burkholderia sp. Ac-20353 TaxID=2703894 RepID=UPI00197BF49E|nr:HAD-IA family hydrolase [Burkholderia sp. Ac-20353]MBN3785938.1 HAD-IA family hydrolase [Burkholderia sp. Ac-20353]